MDAAGQPQVYEVKKYPNRRFYDVTRSRHVGLADLYDLVRHGHRIVVTDSRTGADITNIVLTQIILEHDPPKLDLFPPALLHQAIQANQQMVRKFIDQYFAQAMDAFVQSRRQFDEFLQRSGFSALQPMAPFDWVRMLFPAAVTPPAASPAAPTPSPDATPPSDPLSGLRAEVESLRKDLAGLRSARRKPRRKTGRS